jgi:hypothetical protein
VLVSGEDVLVSGEDVLVSGEDALVSGEPLWAGASFADGWGDWSGWPPGAVPPAELASAAAGSKSAMAATGAACTNTRRALIATGERGTHTSLPFSSFLLIHTQTAVNRKCRQVNELRGVSSSKTRNVLSASA